MNNLLVITLIILFFLSIRNKYDCDSTPPLNVGGPTSHVPMPMARWNYM